MTIVLVAGSRSVDSSKIVNKAITDSPFEITVLIHGGAEGVDTFAKQWAVLNGVPHSATEPDYDKYPASKAPLKRNEELTENAEAAITIRQNQSSGTGHVMHLLSEEQGMEMLEKVELSIDDEQATVRYWR